MVTLKKCYDCGKSYSSNYNLCPHCGVTTKYCLICKRNVPDLSECVYCKRRLGDYKVLCSTCGAVMFFNDNVCPNCKEYDFFVDQYKREFENVACTYTNDVGSRCNNGKIYSESMERNGNDINFIRSLHDYTILVDRGVHTIFWSSRTCPKCKGTGKQKNDKRLKL